MLSHLTLLSGFCRNWHVASSMGCRGLYWDGFRSEQVSHKEELDLCRRSALLNDRFMSPRPYSTGQMSGSHGVSLAP